MIKELVAKEVISRFLSGLWNAVTGVFKKKPLTLEEIKKRTHVLFIDDESFTPLLESIRRAGWNTSQINDVSNLDSEDIKKSDIIFVDYKGVGQVMTPSEEGIGLLRALKTKYPLKHLIFYSGYAGVIPGDQVHDIADGWIQKNSDPYVYIARIESAARKIYDRE